MRHVELLAPAGDWEKLESAISYGADAVYAGGSSFGLRAAAGNFDRDGLRSALEYVHQCGRKFYLTLNAFLRPDELAQLPAYLEELRPLATDAYIVSDPGVIALVREIDPRRPLHLSTQANTTNGAAVEFWRAQGVERVNLARELTLAEIAAIRRQTAAELEVFVHGAMCVSWSGRCLISATLNRRSANSGACTHPCRWRYALVEESRPGEYFPVEEDARGTYLFNSRDLCLIDHLPELLAAGVDSLKIEGRMKSRYYVAAVTRVYRAALDAWRADPDGYRCDPAWRAELEMVSHRPYDRGFLFGHRDDALIHDGDARYRRSHDFVGEIEAVTADGRGRVRARNPFSHGEDLELIGPALRQTRFTVADVLTEDGFPLSRVNPNARVTMTLPPGAQAGDMLRREVKGKVE